MMKKRKRTKATTKAMSETPKSRKAKSPKKVRVVVSRGDDLHVFEVTSAKGITPVMVRRGMAAFANSLRYVSTWDLMQVFARQDTGSKPVSNMKRREKAKVIDAVK